MVGVLPIVENMLSGDATRPGDIVKSLSGKTVEIGNTDAEGRVVLADALAFACEQSPDLVMDFATLTGAARIALGTDLPPVFSNDLSIANDIVAAGEQEEPGVASWVSAPSSVDVETHESGDTELSFFREKSSNESHAFSSMNFSNTSAATSFPWEFQ